MTPTSGASPIPGAGSRTNSTSNSTTSTPTSAAAVTATGDCASAGRCTLVRKVGNRPYLSTDPVLGMYEVDPDHCIRRTVADVLDG